MTTSAPAGYHTLTPRIFVEDVAGMVDFLRATFDATGDLQLSRPSEIRIGDSLLMVSGTEFRGAMPACLYVYVDDLDETYRRALEGGAETMEAPGDTPYGDRRAMVRDRWDNLWQIATRQHPS
jgi:uncharacterized glyoxalase superfamily protein PhnB